MVRTACLRPGNSACVFSVALCLCGVGMAHAGQVQRIPRQTFSNAAAITGIVTTQQGLGLGGVSVELQNLTSGRSIAATTNGDGSFRYLNLTPGRYQIKASHDGFLPFAQGEINLGAGDVYPLMFAMSAA